jgi:ABC-type cobalamin/Fe3+-siderophores transport system ATPase subunit
VEPLQEMVVRDVRSVLHVVVRRIREIIRETHLTCIVVTHDTAQAARMATRVMTLQRRRVTGIGTVNEVLHA